jgi:hypothetical protein
LQQPPPNLILEHRAAYAEAIQFTRHVAKVDAVVEPKALIDEITGESALGNHFLREPGEPLLEYLATARKQAMRVSPLRNALTRFARFGKNVAFEHCHFIVIIS